jgi:hypothetical protein
MYATKAPFVVVANTCRDVKHKKQCRHKNPCATFQRSGVLHSKTPRRDQNPVLAISSFGLINNTRHAIIVTAKLPRARLSSGRSNERVGHIPRSVSFTAKHPEKTRTRFSQSLPSGRSRMQATRAGQINCAGHADRHAPCYERCFTSLALVVPNGVHAGANFLRGFKRKSANEHW